MIIEVLAAGLAALAGGLAQAISGFGFALVAVPLLGLALSARESVVVVTITSCVLALAVTRRERANVDRRLAVMITAAAAVGMPLGLFGLLTMPSRQLSLVIAVVTVIFVCLSLARWRPRSGRWSTMSAGLLSGAALTATGMNGPPLVAAIHGMRMQPARQRATLQAIFAFQDVIAVILFAVEGQLLGRILAPLVMAVPAAWAGWAVGDVLYARIDQTLARRIVLAVMLIASSVLILRAI